MCIIRKFVVWFDSSSFFPLLPGITPFLFLSEGLPLSSFPPFGAYFVNPRANPAEKSLLFCHLKSAPAGEKPDPSGSDKCDCFCITLIYEDEKMFNITNYQRNANQNCNEVSPHTSQNGHHQKSTNNKYWRRCGEKGTLLHC